MLSAASSHGDIAIALVVIWAVWMLFRFLDYKQRAEIPTQENTIKRIAEHQGAERFATWKVTRAIVNFVLTLFVLYIFIQLVKK